MTYLFLSAVAMCMCVISFDYAYRLPNIESAYLGLYKGIVEEAVVPISSTGDYLMKPYFYLPKLHSAVGDYLEKNLSQYARYTYRVFRDPQDLTYAPTGYANKVRITFTARLNDLRSVEKSAGFAIWRTNNE